MIVKIVEKVHSCEQCPNFEKVPSTCRADYSVNYLCVASMKLLGNSDSMSSRMKIHNKVSELCPFKNDEVNLRPKRER